MNYDKIKQETVERFQSIHKNFTKLFGTDDFYIAGGAIRDFVQSCSDPKDYDVFVTCENSYFTINQALEKAGYRVQLTRENSTVYEKEDELDIDVIQVDPGLDRTPMDDFDLTCCTAEFGPDGLNHHPDFFKDVQEQLININKLELPYYTYKRIAKHIRKGYSVTPEVLVKVMDYAVEEMSKTQAPESNDPKSEKSSSL